MAPRVTVVVTTYNQGPYIGPALASVLAQTYPAGEVVVVDDGSTDDTPERLRPFRDRIVYLRHRNRGVAASRNTGVDRATGDLVAFLDGDDLWEPQKLATQVRAALRHPECGLIAADGIQFDGEKILRTTLVSSSISSRIGSSEPLVLHCYEDLLIGNVIPTISQVMIPTAVLRTVGPSDVHFPLASDWDLYLRIAAHYPFAFLGEKLTRWRYLPSSASGPQRLRLLHWTHDSIAVLKSHLGRVPAGDRPPIRAALRAKLRHAGETAYYYGRHHDRRWARQYLLQLLLDNSLCPRVGLYFLALALPQAVTSSVKRFLSKPTA